MGRELWDVDQSEQEEAFRAIEAEMNARAAQAIADAQQLQDAAADAAAKAAQALDAAALLNPM